jgi:hypothetical protein
MAARLRRGSAAAPLLRLRVRIPRGHGCLPLVSVVRCQLEVPTECVCVCVIECDQMQQ